MGYSICLNILQILQWKSILSLKKAVEMKLFDAELSCVDIVSCVTNEKFEYSNIYCCVGDYSRWQKRTQDKDS